MAILKVDLTLVAQMCGIVLGTQKGDRLFTVCILYELTFHNSDFS
jgi:hypothetical protein